MLGYARGDDLTALGAVVQQIQGGLLTLLRRLRRKHRLLILGLAADPCDLGGIAI